MGYDSPALYNVRMDQSLRISQLETELTLLKMQISNAEINLTLPSTNPYRKQELKTELEGLNGKKQKLNDELTLLRSTTNP